MKLHLGTLLFLFCVTVYALEEEAKSDSTIRNGKRNNWKLFHLTTKSSFNFFFSFSIAYFSSGQISQWCLHWNNSKWNLFHCVSSLSVVIEVPDLNVLTIGKNAQTLEVPMRDLVLLDLGSAVLVSIFQSHNESLVNNKLLQSRLSCLWWLLIHQQ